MAKVEKTDQEIADEARDVASRAPKDPADAARAKLLKDGSVADRQAEIAKLQAEIDELSKPPKVEFPKMKYHPNQPATTVASKAQEDALGDGWVDTLADLPETKERMKDAPKASGPAKNAHDDVVAGRR